MGPDPTSAPAGSVADARGLPPGFESIELLNRSNAFEVYDAWDLGRGCRCVVKVIRDDRDGEPGPARALLNEGRLLTSLSHPNIVRGYESGELPRPFLVTETLAGETLAHALDHGVGSLASDDTARMGLQLGSALAYLHRHGHLHLDLKPSNVVASAGLAKLIDLSIARPPGNVKPETGTPGYMPPEQFEGGPVSPASDVWGVGAVMFEAVTGMPLFGDDEIDEPDWTPPELELEGVDERLAGLLTGCLRDEPGRRPALPEVLATLEPIAGIEHGQRYWGNR